MSSKPKRLLLKRQVLERVPYSGVHLYRLMKRGLFPKQISVGANRVAWEEDAIENWIASKIAARDAQSNEQEGVL